MGRVLSGARVVLKELHEHYVPDYLEMFSPTVQRILGVQSTALEREYLCTQIQKQKARRTFFYCVFYKSKNILIGSIEIRSPEHRGQLYTWLHESYWHSGLFQEAFALARGDYFARNPEVTFFTARVDCSNKRSLQALLKAGCCIAYESPGPRERQYQLECRP